MSSSDARALDARLLTQLGRRAFRDDTGLFLAESLKCVLRALRSPHRVVAVVVAPEIARKPQTPDLLASRQASGVPVIRLSPREYRRMSRLTEPPGIAAVVQQRWGALTRTPHTLWLGFDVVRSAGNLGTILRTAEASGVSGNVFLGGRSDPHDPVTVRASMGSLFSQRLVRTDPSHMHAWKHRTGCVVVGASPDGARDYRQVPRRGTVVLMVGDERKGLSRAQRRLCDHLVRIPMAPGVDSLNVGVATGVLLYELIRNRGVPKAPRAQ